MEVTAQGHLEFDNALSTRGVGFLRLNLEDVDHVNIYGLVGMATAVLMAVQKSQKVFITPPRHASACAFMSRLGFDRFLREVGGADCEFPVTSHQDPGDVLVPLQLIRSSGDLTPLQDLLWSRLDGVASPQTLPTVIEALWELGANVTEHSGSAGVFAAVVQGAGRKDTHVDFAIGDAGVGIRRSFLDGTGGHHPNSDHEAITLALQYLVSSIKDPGRGQGLSETVEQSAGLGGRVTVRSGNARRNIIGDRLRKRPYQPSVSAESVPTLGGTLVAVSLPCR